MEEGDGAGEGAADVEVGRAGEEELLHFLVRPLWEGLELGLCGLVSDRKRQRENSLLKICNNRSCKNHEAAHPPVVSNNLSIPRQ